MNGPILGIETTCDETSAAVLDGRGSILSLIVHSQDVHRVYGGVVPELAARDHLRRVEPVVGAALREAGIRRRELVSIAVAVAPGLIGALLVGVTYARAAAFALGVPLVPVHHMEGHLFGPVLEDPEAVPPFVALLVSGGHTLLLWVPEWGRYLLLGETRDDAAGEAFDKVARILGLPYPGGPAIEAAALSGDRARYPFPRPLLGRGRGRGGNARTGPSAGTGPAPDAFDFSFSGLKTAVARAAMELAGETGPDGGAAGRSGREPSQGRLAAERSNLAASFQEAVVDVLACKTLAAVAATACNRVLVGGGVAANRALRDRIRDGIAPDGRLFAGSARLSMDNGAMIARAGLFRLRTGDFGGLAEAAAGAPIPGVAPWSPDPCGRSSRPPPFVTSHG